MWGPALMIVIIISMVIDIQGYENPWNITCDPAGPLDVEVGSAVIINCTYTHEADFTPGTFSWRKCDESSSPNCNRPEMVIFHSGDANAGQDGFKGRVDLLEPDATLLNASIVIRDLKVSDTGSYQLRVEGIYNGWDWRFYFRRRMLIKVTGLAQPQITGKTTVMEGETLKLSCDAESSPPSVVALTKVGSHVPLVSGMQSVVLVLPDATPDHSGRYKCTSVDSVHLTKSLTSIADVTVTATNKCNCPKDLFIVPAVVTSIMTLVNSGVLALALMAACNCCLAKAYRRCMEKTCRHQDVAMRTVRAVEIVETRSQTVTQTGSVVCGLDGPHEEIDGPHEGKALDAVGEGSQE